MWPPRPSFDTRVNAKILIRGESRGWAMGPVILAFTHEKTAGRGGRHATTLLRAPRPGRVASTACNTTKAPPPPPPPPFPAPQADSGILRSRTPYEGSTPRSSLLPFDGTSSPPPGKRYFPSGRTPHQPPAESFAAVYDR